MVHRNLQFITHHNAKDDQTKMQQVYFKYCTLHKLTQNRFSYKFLHSHSKFF